MRLCPESFVTDNEQDCIRSAQAVGQQGRLAEVGQVAAVGCDRVGRCLVTFAKLEMTALISFLRVMRPFAGLGFSFGRF
jgi:hypothetical protein